MPLHSIQVNKVQK